MGIMTGWPGIRIINFATIGLGLGEFFHVDAPAESIDLGDFALVALVLALLDEDLIVLAHRHGAHAVLLPQILG